MSKMKKVLVATALAMVAASGVAAKTTAKFTGAHHMSQHGKMCQYKTKHGDLYWFSFKVGNCADSMMV